MVLSLKRFLANACWLISVLVCLFAINMSACRDANLEEFSPEQRDIAQKLRRSGAFLSTDEHGRISFLWFYANPEKYRPKVTDDTVACLSQIDSLSSVDFSETAITDRGLDAIIPSVGLRSLALPGSRRITDSGLRKIATFQRLQTLVASDTGITDAGLSALANLSELRVLVLLNTNTTMEGLVHIGEKKQLRVLPLSGTSVSDRGAGVIQRFGSLTELNLSGTAVTDLGVVEIDRTISKLTVLNLRSTGITDFSLKLVSESASLRELDVSSTSVSDEGVAWLQAIPNLQRLLISNTNVSPKIGSQLVKFPGLKEVFAANVGLSQSDVELMKQQGIHLVID